MVSRASIYYFEIEHRGCWTTITRDLDVVVYLLRQEFRDPEVFRASIAIIGRDARHFITRMRRSREIIGVNVYFFREGRSANGEKTKFALIDFDNRRHGATSDLIYRLGGIVLRHEISSGLERWRVLLPRSSKRIEESFDRSLREMGNLVWVQKKDLEPSMIGNNVNADVMLTSYEKRILAVALGSGYMDYPRKAKVAELAKIMGVSPATFIYHLRKAEKKLASLALLE